MALGFTDVAGAMGPADVVFGWVQNGTAMVSDRFINSSKAVLGVWGTVFVEALILLI